MQFPAIDDMHSVSLYAFFALAQIAILGQGFFAYLAARKAKDLSAVAVEKTDKIAASVNGHLDDLKTQLAAALAENKTLIAKNAARPVA